MMELEDLRVIILDERESGRLCVISPETFEMTQKQISDLYSEVYGEAHSIDTFLSEHARDVLEEIASMRETTQEIIRQRSRKILMLAMLQTESGYVDKAEIKKMLPLEKRMFNEITGAIERCHKSLTSGDEEVTLTGEPEGTPLQESLPVPDVVQPVTQATSPAPGQTAPPVTMVPVSPVTERAREDNSDLLLVLKDTEPFMGTDGRVYTLTREDLVTVPAMNAGVLYERNIALNIKVGK